MANVALARDQASEMLEGGAEKKEKNLFLGENVDNKKINKAITHLDVLLDKIYNFLADLRKNVLSYIYLIKNWRNTAGAARYSAAFAEHITHDLNEIAAWIPSFLRGIQDDIESTEAAIAKLRGENHALDSEKRLERQQFRNLQRDARRNQNLDINQKEAVLKKKNELNRSIKAINEEIIKIAQKTIDQVLNPDIEGVKLLSEERSRIKQRSSRARANWKAFASFLEDLARYVEQKMNFAVNMKARNRMLANAMVQFEAALKQKFKLYGQKSVYDKEYYSFLVREQSAGGHEAAMGRIKDAL